MAKLSICIPIHEMENKKFFLDRALRSIDEQTFKDYEIIITEEGKMAENTNAAIKKATGEIIKILYMDDYLMNKHSLQRIVDEFKGGWLVTGCMHDDGEMIGNYHKPAWNDNIHLVNTIGSPSVLAFENKDPLLFDETLSWMLDADLYRRLYERYGLPTILDEDNVCIGIGSHQMTYKLTDEEKLKEVDYVTQKYE